MRRGLRYVLAGLLIGLIAPSAWAQIEPVETTLVHMVQGTGLPDGVLQYHGTRTDYLGSFGINISPTAGLAANPAALAAFNRAANQWISRIADPITITINADLANLGDPNVIGQTSSVQLVGSYNTIRNAMVNDALDEGLDDAINAFLPTAATFSAILPTGFGLSSNMIANKANLKALGFANLDALFGAFDGTISFNSTFDFDYDNSDGVGPGLVDFETTAAHEIGHLLGFTSTVDTVDFLLSQGQSGIIAANPLDLFRFQNNVAGRDPLTTADFSQFPRFLSTGGDAIADTIATEYRMSTGAFTGDLRQASHWKDNDLTGTLIGLMDPTLDDQTIIPVLASDLRALDLIGYEIATPQQVIPEPGSLALFGLGALGMIGCVRRRRRGLPQSS